MDRDTHDKTQEIARSEQLNHFENIAKGIDTTIANSQRQFDATMGRIEQTVKNTEPQAVIEFQELRPYGPSFPIAARKQLAFNMAFTNSGNDTAQNVYYDVKFYIGILDDKETQRKFAADFDSWWPLSKHQGKGSSLSPTLPAFNSFKTENLTESEAQAVLNHQMTKMTIYFLIRFSYSDRTGSWIGDKCFGMQDPTHDLIVGHPCQYHNNHRYRATSTTNLH